MRSDLLARVDGLRSRRTPFVLATVVRAERPTSAKPGDCAVVTADGMLDGFVGGVCAESTVRVESLRLLAAGESELLRITPDPGEAAAQDGVRTVGNPCLSGGTLEIFLEAMIPPVLVAVFGESPVARALERVGAALDWDVRVGLEPLTADTSAVVVASHGRDEIRVLRAALDAGVDYIALVASRRRAAGVLRELVATDDERARIQAPAGLDIGARSAGEIALSVCAGIVAARPRVAQPRRDDPAPPASAPMVAVDPICGMEVLAGEGTLQAGDAYFCGPGCLAAWQARA
jgi:xanthine dehydrogenase accessory factor